MGLILRPGRSLTAEYGRTIHWPRMAIIALSEELAVFICGLVGSVFDSRLLSCLDPGLGVEHDGDSATPQSVENSCSLVGKLGYILGEINGSAKTPNHGIPSVV
jgi:hypothetical protein